MKVALVTGGRRGIGRACAERLAADGLRVLIADRAGAEQAAVRARRRAGDTLPTSPRRDQTIALAERVLGGHGRCDVLVNNAAQLGMSTLRAARPRDLSGAFERVNVEAPLLLCARLLPAMAANGGGRVVNIVSNTVWAPPGPGMTAYITSKGALLGMTRALAVEYGELATSP